ncbi:MAG: replication initiator protein [Arizlama microvirus]|nr:MAG: replication initiator protein [Arizlama microvirus]
MPCDSPFWVLPKGATQSVPVPCGRCPPCKKRRVDGWVFRLQQEEKRSSTARFITLTYGPHSLPISPNGWMTLDKSDLQKYFKRLRKLCPSVNVRYYACGEYGSKSKRPHYHAIVFNVPDDNMFYSAWSLDGVPIGAVHVGQVSNNSIAYTMKYIDKSNFFAFHDKDDRVPEFPLMSKGLGSNYVTPQIVDYHHDDYSRLYLTTDGGHKIAMPRYYKGRIYNADDGGHQFRLIQVAMADKESANLAKYLSLYGNNPNYTYPQFCEAQRLGRYRSFYARQKSRQKL